MVPACYVSGFAWRSMFILTWTCCNSWLCCYHSGHGKEDATRTEHWTLKFDVEKLLLTSSAEPRSGACLLRQWVRVEVHVHPYLDPLQLLVVLLPFKPRQGRYNKNRALDAEIRC